MKTLTISLDDDTYRQVCQQAAAADTTVAALVRGYLKQHAPTPAATPADQRKKQAAVLAKLQARAGSFAAADRLPREELYDRHAIH